MKNNDRDLATTVNELKALSKKRKDLLDEFAKINREDCAVKNQRYETIKILAEDLKQILNADDFEELYSHLPPKRKGEPG